MKTEEEYLYVFFKTFGAYENESLVMAAKAAQFLATHPDGSSAVDGLIKNRFGNSIGWNRYQEFKATTMIETESLIFDYRENREMMKGLAGYTNTIHTPYDVQIMMKIFDTMKKNIGSLVGQTVVFELAISSFPNGKFPKVKGEVRSLLQETGIVKVFDPNADYYMTQHHPHVYINKTTGLPEPSPDLCHSFSFGQINRVWAVDALS